MKNNILSISQKCGITTNNLTIYLYKHNMIILSLLCNTINDGQMLLHNFLMKKLNDKR
jgi:hypothetical protein